MLYFINKIDLYKDPSIKLNGYVLSYQIIVKNNTWKDKLSRKYELLIFNTWKRIEADWERVDKGFIVCSNLANVNDVLAKQIYDESIKIKEGSWIDSKSVAYTYINSVKLIIRAYNGLLVSENEKPNDFVVLEELINRIPSEIEKLDLWTEIGINSYMANRIDISKKIYNSHVLPLLQGLFNKSLEIESSLNSIILIHNFNSDLALEYLQSVSEEAREEAYSKICDFYISKRNPYEVYDRGENNKFNFTFDEVSKTINLINLLTTYSYIYNQISTITNALSNNKNTISKPQVAIIATKLREIVNEKLPDTRNIKHQGYKILAHMKIAICNREKVEWEKVIEETDEIPNLSDNIFVKAAILENVSSSKESVYTELRKKLVDDIINNLELFKVHYEYVQRVIDLTDTMYNVDKSRWKEVVNKAFNISNNLEKGSEVYSSKRSIIDSMYRLDISFAKELMKTLDRENKDNHINKLIHDYFETLEMSNKIKNSKELEEKERENYRIIVNGVYKALASLNSEKIIAKK